jgi:hypothetical protein
MAIALGQYRRNAMARIEKEQGMDVEREQEVRELAYRLWQEEGCPDGYEVQHWLKAEVIWQEQNRPKRKPKRSRPPEKRKSRKTSTPEREL